MFTYKSFYPRWGAAVFAIILLLTTLHLTTSNSYADDLGPDNSGCVGGGCPITTTYPQGPNNYSIAQGRDSAISTLIGGDWTIGNGATEAEGLTVVLGSLNMNKTNGNFFTGHVGVGSWVIPSNNDDALIVGGDVTFNTNDDMFYGGFGTGPVSYPMNVVYRGSKTQTGSFTGDFFDNSVGMTGQEIQNAGLDISSYQSILTAAEGRSRCWNGLPNATNGTFTDLGGGSYTFASTDNAAGLYVFNIAGDIDPGFGATVNFNNFPANATILINMLDATPTLRIGTFVINGTTMVAGDHTDQPVAERILWNFPNATDIQLLGASQFWGSIFAPTADMNVETSTNGRILVGGNVTQGTTGGFGLEFHNYPFNGSLPGCDWGDLPDTAVGTGIGNYQTTHADGGPSHIVTSTSPRLGACVDAESNGQPSTTAVGDNNNGTDLSDTTSLDASHVNVNGVCGAGGDEDGVTIAGTPWQDGANGGTINVIGTNGACLNGWIDWDGDGVFTGTNEQVASDFALDGSTQTVQFTIPTGTFSNNLADPDVTLHSRFRITANCGTSDYINPMTGTAVSPTPNGPATNGEVEDYVWSFEPTAVSFSHQMATGSNQTHSGAMFAILALLLLVSVGVLRHYRHTGQH